jgi:hypothetical protein
MAYTPTNAVKINDMTASPLRIALQGAPGTGKTWSAMSFPLPCVIDFDNKLGAHRSRPDVIVLPFHDNNWLRENVYKNLKLSSPMAFEARGEINRANIFLMWLKENASKFEPDQTLILDSWTMLQNNFDSYGRATPEIGKDGKVDKFEFWGRKQSYSMAVLEHLKVLKCSVVVTFHETAERNDAGDLTGKFNPLMDGKVKDQLGQHFTDWYRQLAEQTKDAVGKIDASKPTKYLWQIKSDNLCNCTCSIPHLIKGDLNKVPADYSSLISKP